MPGTRINPAEQLLKRLTWEDLDLGYLRKLVEMARDEDLNGLGLFHKPAKTGDVSTGSLLPSSRTGEADIVARIPLIPCGLRLVQLIISVYGGNASVQLRGKDGVPIEANTVLATVSGDPRTLLRAERIILNFLQRLSGIATFTQTHVAALGSTRTRLLDTRKTTPGHRVLEKYAVACGGGWNHRMGLFDRVMLKDNHLAVLGVPQFLTNIERSKVQNTAATAASLVHSHAALSAAVVRARQECPGIPVEIEVDSIGQIPAALDAGADVVMLDNFSIPDLRRAVKMISGKAFTEASGGITLKMLPRLGGLGLDFVSTGALVHHSVWADIGLDWRT